MTDDEIARLMNAAAGEHWGTEMHFRRFAYALLAAEREACLKTCQMIVADNEYAYADECVAAIIARSKT